METGIYLHIPFCRQKCFYCDFPSFAGREKYMESYTAAVLKEIEMRLAEFDKAATVYVGGGTPTVLPPSLLYQIVGALQPFCDAGTEFTVEANPATVSLELLSNLKSMGVTRLSIGVQSFDDRRLKKIGRIHTADEARMAVQMARKAGFDNVNIDIIYALPGETLNDVRQDVHEAVGCGTEHISIYGLQLEEGTVFHRLSEQGKLLLPDEETAEKMYDHIMNELPRHGYYRYEISNFSKTGFESRHNLGYWQDKPYFGIGAAAHSYIAGQRFFNPMDIPEYIRKITAGILPLKEAEPATRDNQLAEYCFLALRTTAGIDKEKFVIKFGCDIGNIYGKQIEKLKTQELLYETDKRIALTELGMKYGNVAFAEFIL